MEKFDLYQDIAVRTGGDIYLGVVGPVRTGKSTFITKFMDSLVLPNITDKYRKRRVVDEMPQSADGKTIMTTQPKFVPDDAVKITLQGNLNLNVRLIDCVGYLVDGAVGHMEGEKSRLVRTPWSDEEMSFERAGEIGTDKVIKDHSTIGVVVTCDGSFTDIPRGDYVVAEDKVIAQLQSIGKPFVIVLNTKKPNSAEAIALAEELQSLHGVKVLVKNVLEMSASDIEEVLASILLEFPIRRVNIAMPQWMQGLDAENQLIKSAVAEVSLACEKLAKMKDYTVLEEMFGASEDFESISGLEVEFGAGSVTLKLSPKSGVFYKVLSDECGTQVDDDFKLFSFIKSCNHAAKEYAKIEQAMREVEATGYGVVVPTLDDMQLDQPQMMKHSGRYGVKIRATAPSLHIMRVDVETELSPIVGSEEQSQEMIKYLNEQLAQNKDAVWNINMFGKSISNLVKDGLTTKLVGLTGDTQSKMRKTLGRIVNEGKGGVLCVLL